MWTWGKHVITHLDIDGIKQTDSIDNIDATSSRSGTPVTDGRSAVTMTGPGNSASMILSLGSGLRTACARWHRREHAGAGHEGVVASSSSTVAGGQIPGGEEQRRRAVS